MKINLLKDTKKSALKRIKSAKRTTIFSNGRFSCADVLRELVDICGENLEIMIATWQIGHRNIGYLKGLARREDVSLKVLLDISYKNRCFNEYVKLRNSIGDCVWFTKNHSKAMLVSNGEKFFSVLSSANFNENFRFEFFDITEDESLFELIKANYEGFFKSDAIKKEMPRAKVNKNFEKLFSGDESFLGGDL